MKKVNLIFQSICIYIILLLTISTNGFSQQIKGDSFASAKSKGTANMIFICEGVEGFSVTDSNGQMQGLLVDLMKSFKSYVKSKHNITINDTYREVPNKDFSIYLDWVKSSTGGVIGLSNTSYTAERTKFLSLSKPYLNNFVVMITHGSVSTLSNINNVSSEFSSMTGIAVSSTTFETHMRRLKSDKFNTLQIKTYDSVYEMIDNVVANNSTFCYADMNYYLEYKKAGKNIKRHAVGDIGGDSFVLISSLGSDWTPIVNEFLSSGFLSSPEYRAMVIENLGKEALRMVQGL